MSNIGIRLKSLRYKKGLSIKQIALELDISQSTYRDWENGRQITGEPYQKLSEIFSISIFELLTGTKGELYKVFEAVNQVKKSLINLEEELNKQL